MYIVEPRWKGRVKGEVEVTWETLRTISQSLMMHVLSLDKYIHFALMYMTSSSSYRPVSVSRWHAHSRAVVFHTLHRGQQDTIFCPLIIYRSLRVLATVAPSQESSFTYPPSLFSLIPFRRRLCCFPRLLHIMFRLLPPSHP